MVPNGSATRSTTQFGDVGFLRKGMDDMGKLRAASLAGCVMLVAAVSVVALPGASADQHRTCDDYSARRFGLPDEGTEVERGDVPLNSAEPQEEDGHVFTLDRSGAPQTWVTPNSNVTTVGVSQHVHEGGGEIVEAPLPPGTRPIHFFNCNVVAPAEDNL